MKIGVNDTAYASTYVEHINNTVYPITKDCEIILADSPVEGYKNVLNYNEKIDKTLSDEMLLDAFNDLCNITDEYPVVYLYGFLGEIGFSPLIEVSHKSQMMAYDVGIETGFTRGFAIPITDGDVFAAVPDLRNIEDVLVDVGYRGEITIGISRNFKITSIIFGHSQPCFALYNELAKQNLGHTVNWCFGVGDYAAMNEDAIAITTLLSYPPFPYTSPELTEIIKVPPAAEKHTYHYTGGMHNLAYTAAWGVSLPEAIRRIAITLKKSSAYKKELQYRSDFRYDTKLLIGQDKLEELIRFTNP